MQWCVSDCSRGPARTGRDRQSAALQPVTRWRAIDSVDWAECGCEEGGTEHSSPHTPEPAEPLPMEYNATECGPRSSVGLPWQVVKLQ